MLPWGHFAVGYICYSLGLRARTGHPPSLPTAIALTLGTQCPDLIDKPLADVLGVLPSGRSLGHSLVIAVVLGLGVWVLAHRADRIPEAGAFLFGHVSHIVVDAVPAALAGRWVELGFLGWPLTPAYRYPADVEGRAVVDFVVGQLISGPHHELVLFALAVVLWLSDSRASRPTRIE